jgi:hypothetical protein
MVKTKVNPGVCGFIADIEAEVRDYQFVKLRVNSSCEKISAIAEMLNKKEFNAYNEIRDGFDGEFYKIIKENLKGACSACAVPIGMFKSMQVVADLALPRDVLIEIKK